MLLNRVECRIFAIKDRCLHRGVTLSDRIECYSKQTISCWYHVWTYRWDSGKLVDILTNPKSVQTGCHALKTYHVEEVQGVVFVYVGDGEPHALLEDVPTGFLDADRAIEGQHCSVAATWRMGTETSSDAVHLFIPTSPNILHENETALPLVSPPATADK